MKVGVFIPSLPLPDRQITTFDHMVKFENTFVCIPNGMQDIQHYPSWAKILPIGGKIIEARNNIMQYAQQHKYDAIWVIDDDLKRFVTIVDGEPQTSKFVPYVMSCRVGGIGAPLFMKDTYERYIDKNNRKHGMINGIFYFEDFSIRYRDREVYGHEDCDLFLRLCAENDPPVIDTTHFKEFNQKPELSITRSYNPKYEWLLYREWGDFVTFSRNAQVKYDKRFLNKPKTHTKYPIDVTEFLSFIMQRQKRRYRVDDIIKTIPKELRTV